MSYEQHHAALHIIPDKGGYKTDVIEEYDKYNTLLVEGKSDSVQEKAKNLKVSTLHKKALKKKSYIPVAIGEVICHPKYGNGIVKERIINDKIRLKIEFESLQEDKIMDEQWVANNCRNKQNS